MRWKETDHIAAPACDVVFFCTFFIVIRTVS